MVSLNKAVYIFFVSLLFVTEGFSQVSGAAQRVCGPATMTPTGPVMPDRQFVIPAVIKPLLSACQPAAPATCHPEKPANSAPPAPCDVDDDEDPYDTLLCLLINRILDGKKVPGKRSGSCKSVGYDGYADAGVGDAGCADACGFYPPVFCPYGGADGAGTPDFALTCRSISDASCQ